jgi:hypothetical protein
MKHVLLLLFMLPSVMQAQDRECLARAMEHGPSAVDRWMKRELMARKDGSLVDNGSTTYTSHHATYDSLVDFLKDQPGVQDAGWDRCMMKLASWPGHSSLGVRFVSKGGEHERCYDLQEGRPGNIKLFGWRAHVRRSREQLKFLGAKDCPGFVEEQRRYCEAEHP